MAEKGYLHDSLPYMMVDLDDELPAGTGDAIPNCGVIGIWTRVGSLRDKAFTRFYVRLVTGCNEIAGYAVLVPGTLD